MKITKKSIDWRELKGFKRFEFDSDNSISSMMLRNKKNGSVAIEPVVFIEFEGFKTLEEMLDMILSDIEAMSWCASTVQKADNQADNFSLFLDNIEICVENFSRVNFLLERGFESLDDFKTYKLQKFHINPYCEEYKNLPDCSVW